VPITERVTTPLLAAALLCEGGGSSSSSSLPLTYESIRSVRGITPPCRLLLLLLLLARCLLLNSTERGARCGVIRASRRTVVKWHLQMPNKWNLAF